MDVKFAALLVCKLPLSRDASFFLTKEGQLGYSRFARK
jgi:hypothetical protein